MKRRLTSVSLALLAVSALTALAGVSSASAGPYPKWAVNAKDTFPVSVTGSSSGTARFEVSGGSVATCPGTTRLSGLVTGANGSKEFKLEFENCHTSGFNYLHTTGAPTGKIVLQPAGTLTTQSTWPVYLSASAGTDALRFPYAKAPVFYESGAAAFNIEGPGLLIPITPVNTETKAFELGINGSLGKQEYTQYEEKFLSEGTVNFSPHTNYTFPSNPLSISVGTFTLFSSKLLQVKN